MSGIRVFSEENLEKDLRYCYNRLLNGYKSVTFSRLVTAIEDLYYLGYVSEDLYLFSTDLSDDITFRLGIEEVPHE
ncbi:MAG: hypothetical protein [Inoviridae sp.]|nr:MAG: hypothetical protein [Inoviridae sp.]